MYWEYDSLRQRAERIEHTAQELGIIHQLRAM